MTVSPAENVAAEYTPDSRYNRPVVYLIDASVYVFRAYHSLPPDMTDRDGHPVGTEQRPGDGVRPNLDPAQLEHPERQRRADPRLHEAFESGDAQRRCDEHHRGEDEPGRRGGAAQPEGDRRDVVHVLVSLPSAPPRFAVGSRSATLRA